MAYVFVGGSARSGTSMLQLLLCQAEGTNPMMRDATYLRGIVSLYEAARDDLPSDTGYYFDDVDDLRSFHIDLAETFLQKQLARFPDAEHLVLKDPPLTRSFPALFELVPTGRFIVIVRDPRDAIASMNTVGEKMQAAGQRHLFQNRDARELCDYFISYYAPSFHCADTVFRERTLLVRYEDVVRNPERVIPRLAEFTGFEFQFDPASAPDTGVVDYAKVDEKHESWHTERFGKPLDASSIGRFRTILSTEEIAAIEGHCGSFMERFGYVKIAEPKIEA